MDNLKKSLDINEKALPRDKTRGSALSYVYYYAIISRGEKSIAIHRFIKIKLLKINQKNQCFQSGQ